ncbi:hypothetical protein B0A49_08060 [Cryomyces minteri]|uniref:Sulfotransferase domain-containing protein n=1 Tax=Cryomyces minteri TaxID=331657 RepID=A0A4U0WVH7_9PEZI|nr:hypothetical protein B0A49_08060 [Cryomyces minteri]
MDTDRGRRFYLITYPRTASNLLVRILNLGEQPNILKLEGTGWGYFFLDTHYLSYELQTAGKPLQEWTQSQRRQTMDSFQRGFKEFEKYVATARTEDKMVFVKEHSIFLTEPTALSRFAYGEDSVDETPWVMQPSGYVPELRRSSLNQTCLPDEFLQTWRPTFLIRHPALVFPSLYRALLDTHRVLEAGPTSDAHLKTLMTMHWTRTLHDWYAENVKPTLSESNGGVTWPIVVDADDVMTNPETVGRLCEIIGLDSTKLQYAWEPASEEQRAHLPTDDVRRFLSTLLSSSSVQKGKTSHDLDMAVETKKWREEFGEMQGAKLEKWVKDAMPDYEFLKAKRLRPTPST